MRDTENESLSDVDYDLGEVEVMPTALAAARTAEQESAPEDGRR